MRLISNTLCHCYKETKIRILESLQKPFPIPLLPLSRYLQGSNFQDPGISRKNGEIGKFARLAAPQNWLFNGSRLESSGSIASRGGGQAARRDFEEVAQIARRSLLLQENYTALRSRVPPPPWNFHNPVENFFTLLLHGPFDSAFMREKTMQMAPAYNKRPAARISRTRPE